MLNNPLQTAIVAVAVLYILYLVVSLHQRRKIASGLLTAMLKAMTPDREQWHQLTLDQGQAAAWERWRVMQSAGLWSMYVNAGVMLEIAGFIDQNSEGVDGEILEALRNDATQIRGCVLTELTKYACTQLSEQTIGNAAHAATYYADMLSKTAQLLERTKIEGAPGFAGSLG